MQIPSGHRKRVKHYDDCRHVRELTFSCYQRQPLLIDDVWRQMLSRCVDQAMQHHGYRLTAFAFMPEHVHLVTFPLREASGIDALLRAIKRPFSYRVKQLLARGRSPLLDRLMIRQRPGITTFRYWQEGPGYDRNLVSATATATAIDYVLQNPVRRGLADVAVAWKWSSARYYHVDPPQQDPDLPIIEPLPVEWLH
jgi:putative transposase